MIRATLVGQRETAGVAQEKTQAEMGLKASHLLRHGSLRDAELLGGRAEGEMPSGRLEGAKTVERGKRAVRLTR